MGDMTVTVRHLDEEVVAAHRRRAEARGVSLEEELRDALVRAAKPTREELLAKLDRIRAMTPRLPPGVERTPSEVLIREDRDSR